MCADAGHPITRKKAKQVLAEEMKADIWANDTYTVLCRSGADADGVVQIEEFKGKCTYLSIRRNDREPVDSWRDFQEIKNQICGPEREGLQIYPAESRLADNANQYHLFVMPEGATIPFGFHEGRMVNSKSIEIDGQTTKQSNR